MKAPWIGCDLDGCLASDAGVTFGKDYTGIGQPVPAMVRRIKALIAQGKTVKIFTARVAEPDQEKRARIEMAIQLWCKRHIGKELEVTNCKDFSMLYCYDDRCVQVERNTGKIVGEDWDD